MDLSRIDRLGSGVKGLREMNAALLKLGRSLALVAVFAICGGQWAALQTLAWGRMLVDYTQQLTITQAIAKTFDGVHQCPMCKQVETGSSKQKQPRQQGNLAKQVLLYTSAQSFIFPKPSGFRYPLADLLAKTRKQEPPSPPPRARLA
jgi:hypothetical protein